RRLVEDGADALDVGAESTRPDARPVTAAEEIARLRPVLERLRDLDVPISVDTTKAAVAEAALGAGACIINDISGLQRDPEIADACAEAGAALILMHMRGEPATMRGLAHYDDVVTETIRFLGSAVEEAVRRGVPERRILVDPGIGFAKTAGHNLEILRRLGEYRSLHRPVVLGASRKSFLAPYDGATTADRLEGTLATSVIAVLAGVDVLRVHDVRANRRAILTTEAVAAPEACPC
ncbi:dihydropteroate synthase, partial [bacterium]|nr:dihydropteroate synthase [bacterium]